MNGEKSWPGRAPMARRRKGGKLNRDDLIRLCAEVVSGIRPSGGPYVVTVTEGPRWETDREWRIYLRLVDRSTEESHVTGLPRQEWQDVLLSIITIQLGVLVTLWR